MPMAMAKTTRSTSTSSSSSNSNSNSNSSDEEERLSLLSPLLTAAGMDFPHRFSLPQMEALAALCDTYVPPLQYDGTCSPSPMLQVAACDPLSAFYALSASNAGVPPYVAGLLHSKLKPSILQIVGWVLWLLSTRLGTFLMFGRDSLCGKFPFLRRFGDIPTPERERLLFSQWSHSNILFFRSLFHIFCDLTVLSFYTKVDEKNENPTWKAIGYPGPKPPAASLSTEGYGYDGADSFHKKPLEGAVIMTTEPDLESKLKAKGFTVEANIATRLEALWKPKTKETKALASIGVQCDAVVVGSGCGGGVVAAILAQAGYKVLVLEKGLYLARADLSLLEGPSLEHMYEGGGILLTDNGSVQILAGATVGGGSTINWSASFRTPDHVLQEWQSEHGLPLFTNCAYQEAMDAVFSRLRIQDSVGDNESFHNQILRNGCCRLGYHVEDVARNSPPDHNCGWCGFGCLTGRKQSTAETWLKDAVSNGSAILAGCEALSIIHSPNSNPDSNHNTGLHKAVGVVATAGENRLVFVEARVIVASGGSLNTPPLLLRSGLQNPHIGKHLHLHPVQMLWGYFPDKGNDIDKGNNTDDKDDITSIPLGVSFEGGIITAISKEMGSSPDRRHGCILETPSLHPGTFSGLMPWVTGFDHKERMRWFPRTAHVFALQRDHGSGIVRVGNDNGISIDYNLHPDDKDALMEGADLALRVLIAAGAAEVGTHHIDGDRLKVTGASHEVIEDFLQRVKAKRIGRLAIPLCSAHQMGSCRMGSNPTTSVVNGDGETWEVQGLFVADASVFPTSIGVNPYVTTQAIAYCIAHSVVRHLEKGKLRV